MIYQLPDNDTWFPDPQAIPEDQREQDGLYAIGGDLSTDRLIEAYAQGIFPWTDYHSDTLYWYCPMQRFVIFPHEIHISHSMRSLLRKGMLRVTIDQAFEQVIAQCSALRIDLEGAWLGPQMVEAYTKLHRLGYAHSVEVWQEDQLAGGLYGVAEGPVFIGESMFSLQPSASKVALIYLAQYIQKIGGKMIDCQLETPHLRSMGGRYISYDEYMQIFYNGVEDEKE